MDKSYQRMAATRLRDYQHLALGKPKEEVCRYANNKKATTINDKLEKELTKDYPEARSWVSNLVNKWESTLPQPSSSFQGNQPLRSFRLACLWIYHEKKGTIPILEDAIKGTSYDFLPSLFTPVIEDNATSMKVSMSYVKEVWKATAQKGAGGSS